VKTCILISDADTKLWKEPIIHALNCINARSGNRYSAEQIYNSLVAWQNAAGANTSIWLMLDTEKIDAGIDPKHCVTGFLTLDVNRDDVGNPTVMISRAWSGSGLGKLQWGMLKPKIAAWGQYRGCKRMQIQTERASAMERFLKQDGFVSKEVILEATL
jgi:hypothetical protein